MPESKPSAMEQIIQALEGVLAAHGGTTAHLGTSPEASAVRAALSAARAMQEQQAQPWHDEKPDQWTPEIEAAHPMRSGAHDEYATAMEMVGNRRNKGALVELVCWLLQRRSPSAPPVAGDERTSAAPEGLAAHAIEELCQLGYTVRDGQLIPPDNLHELARVAGWASPSGSRTTPPVAGDSVQQPVAVKFEKVDTTLEEEQALRSGAAADERTSAPATISGAEKGEQVERQLNALTDAVIQQAAQPSEAQQAAKPVAAEPQPDYDAWNLCSRLNGALERIAEFAHDRSTGPAVPDALWEVRQMAYDAMEEVASPTAQAPATQLPQEWLTNLKDAARYLLQNGQTKQGLAVQACITMLEDDSE